LLQEILVRFLSASYSSNKQSDVSLFDRSARHCVNLRIPSKMIDQKGMSVIAEDWDGNVTANENPR
jgi:hypothetical protein